MDTNGLMNLQDADDLLNGVVRLRGGVTVNLGSNPNWAQTGLPTGTARSLYSLKWVEELIREWRRSGDDRYVTKAVQIVNDFAADNPVGGGPDPVDVWFPMHAGQRATSIACVLDASGDAGVAQALSAHGSWLSGVVGGLDAWNQAIDPNLGLLAAGCDRNVGSWRSQAVGEMGGLVNAIIDGEGALNEQAPGYGRFVWERWGAVDDKMRDCGVTPPANIEQRRDLLLEWLAWASAPDGRVAPIGDSFSTNVPRAPAGSPTEYTTTQGAQGSPHTDELVRVFDAGWVFGRTSWTDFASSSYWTLRFGPGRDLHGHEDHQSVTFWADGREILVDSGHEGYNDSSFRDHLMSPRAHNVMTLPDIENRLRRPTILTRTGEGSGWTFHEVSDDTYGHQGGIVSAPRTRGLLMLPGLDAMVVQDRAVRVNSGLFEQLWHLVPGATILSTNQTGVTARHPSGDVDIHIRQVPLPGQSLPSPATSVVQGQTNPYFGWFADSPDVRTPIPVVSLRRSGTSTRMVTVVAVTPVGGSISAAPVSTTNGWQIDLDLDGESVDVGIGVDGEMLVGTVPPPADIEPVRPGRVLDTRDNGVTIDSVSEAVGSFSPGRTVEIQVVGRVGVPDGASAAMINLTAIAPGGPGFATLFPCDEGRPNASTINFVAGQNVANASVVALSGRGTVCLYTSEWAHFALDTTGYLPGVSAVEPITPARVLDTRSGGSTVDGRSEGIGFRRAGNVVEVQVAGRAGVPSNASSAMLNLTAIQPSGPGFATLYTCDGDRPNASTVNFIPGRNIANASMVGLSDDGTVCLYTSERSHFAIDATGYVPDGSSVDDVTPGRVLDTRPGQSTVDRRSEGRGTVRGGQTITIQIAGRAGVPSNATIAMLNLTAIQPSGNGFATLFACDTGQPTASTVNYVPGGTVANASAVGLSADGSVCLYSSSPVDFALDATGYLTE
ncbi:MAG: heparinase II/III family protein [Actinomycetota bacterium]